jgi:hypothetical protein
VAMRLLLLACSAWFLVAVEPRPLLDRASDQDRVLPVLMRLSQGDPAPLLGLDAQAFQAEVGIADPEDPRLIHRWSSLLPRALDRLNPTRRAEVLAEMDSRFTVLMASLTEEDRLRVAAAFLPAPAARQVIEAAADSAFDLGRFRDYRAWSNLLGTADIRNDAADQWGGFAKVIATELRLTDPGPLQPTAAKPDAVVSGITVRWHRSAGWLLACDPSEQVRWQYHTEMDAQVVPGDGGALLREAGGIRFIREDGSVIALPPLPTGGEMLAVAGGSAWFQVDRVIHQWSEEHGLRSVTLPSPALSAPLVRGPDSLWLTATDILLVRDGAISAQYRHQRQVDRQCRLALEGEEPLLVHANGSTERITALTTVLADAPPQVAFEHLLRAHQADLVIARCDADPELAADPTVRPWLLMAHLQRSHIESPEQVFALAETLSEQSQILMRLHQQEGGVWTTRLLQWCQDHSDVQVRPLASDPLEAVHAAPWVVRAGSWRTAEMNPRLPHTAIGPAQPWTKPDPQPQRLANGGWELGSLRWTLHADIAWTTLTCENLDGFSQWRRRWPAPNILDAPGRELRVTPDAVIVIEGARRVRLFDPISGNQRDELELGGHDVAADEIVIAPQGGIAVLRPA